MESIRDYVSSLLSSVAAGLKLKQSDFERIKSWKHKLEQSSRDNNDRVQELKDELRKVEARLLKLDDEFRREHGAVRQVVSRQMESACSELKQKQGRVELLFENLDKETVALQKIAELEEAFRRGVTATQADGLAVELEEAFEAVARSDEAMDDAASVRYKSPERSPVNVEHQLRQIRGSAPALSSATESMVSRLRNGKTSVREE